MAEELLERERAEAAQHEEHARRMADEAGLDPDRDLDTARTTADVPDRGDRFDHGDTDREGTEGGPTEGDPATGPDLR
jgi:hypothetical protein